MCGINGIFAYADAAPPVDEAELLRTRERMIKRGPDGAGLWMSADRRVGLAHRRLAIIDLSETGAQPMATQDGRLRITFNGEIYNYRELRRELEAKGFAFHSNSDTEVLLHLYADRGPDMVHALRGMYAFGIWDNARQRMFLARDPFGIKPLYFADDGTTLRFASQVKALLHGVVADRTPEPAATVGFLILGSVPEPYTLYRGIRSLGAGCALTVDRAQGMREWNHFSIRDELAAAQERGWSRSEQQSALAAAMTRSVRDHLVADVPVGLFLSSGVDSAMVAAIAARESKLRSLTLGFDEYRGTRGDETSLAAALARQFGIPHTTHWIGRDEFLADVDNIIAAMDQPSIDGVNTYLVSKVAAQAGLKVALSGVGGDELFAGYSTFRRVPLLVRSLAFMRRLGGVGRQLRRALSRPIARIGSPKAAGLFEYGSSYAGAYLLARSLFMPWELDDILEPAFVQEGIQKLALMERLSDSIRGIDTPRSRVAALEMQWYLRNQLLRDADWAGMAHSIEIRTPLVDATLFKAMAPFLASAGRFDKYVVARALQGAIPESTFRREKTGFSVPVREWLAGGSGARPLQRGLRSWALRVGAIPQRRRVLALVTDAFGGHGGIALYTRDVLHALSTFPGCAEVVALPRLMPRPPEPMPDRLVYETSALGGKRRYFVALIRELLRWNQTHLVVCCHLNLLPLARLAKRLTGAPLIVFIYGIEAWNRTSWTSTRAALRDVDCVISISKVTANRFLTWSGFDAAKIAILPNAIHLEWYGVGPKSDQLMERYKLRGRKVIMTVGRLVSSERYKGFDEVLDAMPALLACVPDLVYLIVGGGGDRGRLEEKVRRSGLSEHVVFTGFVDEAEKASHYRLADAYVMPSRGEGFGFVLLEALACGIPVVGSTADGTREAVREGMLGALVDPDDRQQIREATLRALAQRERTIPPGLEHFSFLNFVERAHKLVARSVRD